MKNYFFGFLDNEKVRKLYGFDKANKILRLFSKLIPESAPTKSVVARLYGASFGIIVKDYDKSSIQEIVKLLSKNFLKDKELSKTVNFSTIAFRVSKDITLSEIYKKLQSGVDNKEEINSLFLE